MTTKEYLEQYREDVPEWLRGYRRGGSRPLADFLRSRIVYYPDDDYWGGFVFDCRSLPASRSR